MHVLATLLTYILHATVSVILCEWYHYALINIHVNMLLTVNNFIMMLHLTVTYEWYVLVTPLTIYCMYMYIMYIKLLPACYMWFQHECFMCIYNFTTVCTTLETSLNASCC